MTFQSDTSVADIVLQVLRGRRVILRFPALVAEIIDRYGRAPPERSLRVALTRMVAKGQLVRPYQGAYCLPGNEPKPVNIREWVARALVDTWPDWHDADTLQRRFKIDQHHVLPWQTFDGVLVELNGLGKADKQKSLYVWWRPPTMEDRAYPLGQPSIFD